MNYIDAIHAHRALPLVSQYCHYVSDALLVNDVKDNAITRWVDMNWYGMYDIPYYVIKRCGINSNTVLTCCKDKHYNTLRYLLYPRGNKPPLYSDVDCVNEHHINILMELYTSSCTPTCLYDAKQSFEFTRYIVEHSKRDVVNMVSHSGDTALIHACTYGIDIEEIEYLIKHTTNINHENNRHDTALCAVMHHFNYYANYRPGDIEYAFKVIQLLIDNGADINRRNNSYGRGILEDAVTFKHLTIDLFKYLLDHGLDLYPNNEQNYTSPNSMLYYISSDILKFIIEYIENRDGKEAAIKYIIHNNYTLIDRLINNDNIDIIDTLKYLVEYGRQSDGTTLTSLAHHDNLLVHLASQYNIGSLSKHTRSDAVIVPLVKYIVKQLGNECCNVDKNGDSALLCFIVRKCPYELIEYLVEHSCHNSVNVESKYGNTPLINCIIDKDYDYACKLIRFLVKHGADIHAKNKHGVSFVDHLFKSKRHDLIDFLWYKI